MWFNGVNMLFTVLALALSVSASRHVISLRGVREDPTGDNAAAEAAAKVQAEGGSAKDAQKAAIEAGKAAAAAASATVNHAAPVMQTIDIMRSQMCWGRPNLHKHEDCLEYLGMHCDVTSTGEGICLKFRKMVAERCEKEPDLALKELICNWNAKLNAQPQVGPGPGPAPAPAPVIVFTAPGPAPAPVPAPSAPAPGPVSAPAGPPGPSPGPYPGDDRDGDGHKNIDDSFPDHAGQYKDSDGDGHGDGDDAYPFNADCYSKTLPCLHKNGTNASAANKTIHQIGNQDPAALTMQEGVERPHQGYDEYKNGTLVSHNDGETWTADWQDEGFELKTKYDWTAKMSKEKKAYLEKMCKEKPEAAWCKKLKM